MNTDIKFHFGDRDPARPDTHLFVQMRYGRPQWRKDTTHAAQLARAVAWSAADAGMLPGMARIMLNNARARSLRYWGEEPAITLEQIISLIPADLKCPVLGRPFTKGNGRFSMTLDRVLNERHYEWGNVRVVCKSVNSAKREWSSPSQHSCRRGLTRDEQRAIAAYARTARAEALAHFAMKK